MLDFDRVRAASLRTDPYHYTVIEDVISADGVDAVVADFPDIRHPGSIPVTEVEYGPGFGRLLDDLNSEAFRAAVSEKFDVDLRGKPIVTTVRGVMREKDGRIHTDSKTKIITVLLYFNRDWDDEGGHLRVLRNGSDLEDYAEEIPPKLGTMLIFRVADNCWHGHKPVVGKRLSIQMNYLVGEGARGKHQFFHRLSARLKKLFS